MLEKHPDLTHAVAPLLDGGYFAVVSRELQKLGHEVIVANARQVKLISESSRKNDRQDARMLARLARMDPALLRPIRHRSEAVQMDLVMVPVRAGLVEARTGLVNTLRGLTKAAGERLVSCDADQMNAEKLEDLPAACKVCSSRWSKQWNC